MIRKFATLYVNSWWLSPLLAVSIVGLWLISLVAEVVYKAQVNGIESTLFWIMLLSWLGLLVSSTRNFVCRRPQAGTFHLCALSVLVVVSWLAYGLIVFRFGWTIEEDAALAPKARPHNSLGQRPRTFHCAGSGLKARTITAEIGIVRAFSPSLSTHRILGRCPRLLWHRAFGPQDL